MQNCTGGSPTYANPMYNNSWSPPTTLFFLPHPQFSKIPTPLKNTKKYLNTPIWSWYMVSTSHYPLLLFISPSVQKLIHINNFLQTPFCGQRPLNNFGGQKSLDSFENRTGRSPTYARPMYNNSWSPPATLFFAPLLNFQKKTIPEIGVIYYLNGGRNM